MGLRPAAASCSPYSANTSGKKARTTWPKMIGSETFIIVALRCTEKRTPSCWARAICSVRNSRRAATRIDGGVDDLTGEHRHRLAKDRGRAVVADELDAQRAVLGDDHRLLARAEVVGAHVRDVGLRVGAPGAHRVRVLAGVVLDRQRSAAVRVALAQDRVDGRALGLVVARPGVLLLVGLGVVGVVRQVVPLLLQLVDRGLELRDGGGDVGQLDDVGLGRLRQGTQLGERVVDPLVLAQAIGELGDDPARERDVPRLDVHAGLGGVRLDDRQERVGRQQGRLVRVRVDDLGHGFRRLLKRGEKFLDVKIPDWLDPPSLAPVWTRGNGASTGLT